MQRADRNNEQLRREKLALRARITCAGLTDAGEQEFLERFLLRYIHKEMKYAVAFEWELVPGYTNLGRGDLVLSNRDVKYRELHIPSIVWIIEAKYITDRRGPTARARNRKHRQHAIEQVQRSANAWKKEHPLDTVCGFVLLNKEAEAWDEAYLHKAKLPTGGREMEVGAAYLYSVDLQAPWRLMKPVSSIRPNSPSDWIPEIFESSELLASNY